MKAEHGELFERWLDGQIWGDIDLGIGASYKNYIDTFNFECSDYCTQNDGNCSTCSLASYGRDCHQNQIKPTSEKAKRIAWWIKKNQKKD